MAWARAALMLVALGAAGAALVSGGSSTDPRTPAGLTGLPPPFLGTAVVGNGGLTAAVDAYGDVVDLRAPGPAGRALIDNPSTRQAAGTVPASTGIVPRVRIDGGPALPLWRADSVAQRYLPATNVVRTTARFRAVRITATVAGTGGRLAAIVGVDVPQSAPAQSTIQVDAKGVDCAQVTAHRLRLLTCGVERGGLSPSSRGPIEADAVHPVPARNALSIIRAALADDRRWVSRATPLGPGAPAWARRLYERSLLTLRALTDARSGAVAAGARDGWAYVWPRDAGTVALAFAAAGYRAEARRVAGFLLGLDLAAAARFDGAGAPVPGRGPQGDAAGWTAVAARAAGLAAPTTPLPWRDRPDYQEGHAGTFLANAIAAVLSPAGGPRPSSQREDSARRAPEARAFVTSRGLVRRAEDPASGLDSAAAWAVRPFPQPALFPAARRTLHRLAAGRTRFGITPGEGWNGGPDPWTAPTAWAAWGLAALADRARDEGLPATARRDRRAALRLLADLRHAATPAGALPERVDVRSGVPRSTTPLAWSHAFAVLTLRQLWPQRG